MDYFSTYSLSYWGNGRLVAYSMLICCGIILWIKMCYDIFYPFNEEEQMILLGSEILEPFVSQTVFGCRHGSLMSFVFFGPTIMH